MAAVPQKVLNWMYNVLKGEYHDPDRTYSDVAQTLAQYPGLSVRTSVYTYENGRSSLLLNVSGTLPTSFRGTTYMFPISLWIPHEYPRDVPMGFATPTQNMVVRAGQYVSGEGRIYHPYLAGWRDDRSNLLQFVSMMQEAFSREPPLIAKHEPPSLPPPRQISNGGPPPVPPLPPEMNRPGSGISTGHGPPPPPPKQHGVTSQSSIHQGGDGPPPVPPRPQHDNEDAGPGKERLSSMYGKPPPPIPSSAPQRTSSLRHSFGPEPPDFQSPSMMQQSSRNDIRDDRSGYPRPIPHGDPRVSQPQYVNQRPVPLPNGDPQLGSNQAQWDHQFPRSPPQQPLNNQYYQQPPHNSQPRIPNQRYPPQPQTQPPPPTPQPKKPPPTDLLTSPFDTPLPPTTPQSTAPAPPIPPNPQKDALLSYLSSTLTSLATQMHTSNSTALPALLAQNRALSTTLGSINSEISSLESLSSLLSSNEKILHSSMASADAVLADAKTRAVPDIDEVLVAPTRVEGQLYEVVCEERAVRESRAFLGRCLDRGRVGGEVWARQTRALAREEFGFLVLGRKIARGLGLQVEGRGGGGGGGDGGAGGGEGWYR